MKIAIKILNGEDLNIEVFEAQTILAVKQRISLERGIPVAQQRLMLSGKPLADGKCICDYRLVNGSKVHLFIKPGNAKAPPQPSSAASKTKKDHFWTMLEKILKKHFSEADCKKLLHQFNEDYQGYLDSLSLDDIETLAGALQDQRQAKALSS